MKGRFPYNNLRQIGRNTKQQYTKKGNHFAVCNIRIIEQARAKYKDKAGINGMQGDKQQMPQPGIDTK